MFLPLSFDNEEREGERPRATAKESRNEVAFLSGASELHMTREFCIFLQTDMHV